MRHIQQITLHCNIQNDNAIDLINQLNYKNKTHTKKLLMRKLSGRKRKKLARKLMKRNLNKIVHRSTYK